MQTVPQIATTTPVQASPAPEAPIIIRQIPRGGGQVILDRRGDQTVITSSALPPDVWRVARGAERTAFGLMGLLAAIVILGPFARMLARRSERRAQSAPALETQALQRQIEQLQQSIDAMSIEMERISESQRFQSKLLFEGRSQAPSLDHVS